jgi:hypothetical protein
MTTFIAPGFWQPIVIHSKYDKHLKCNWLGRQAEIFFGSQNEFDKKIQGKLKDGKVIVEQREKKVVAMSTARKIVISILSFGLIPLFLLISKCAYRLCNRFVVRSTPLRTESQTKIVNLIPTHAAGGISEVKKVPQSISIQEEARQRAIRYIKVCQYFLKDAWNRSKETPKTPFPSDLPGLEQLSFTAIDAKSEEWKQWLLDKDHEEMHLMFGTPEFNMNIMLKKLEDLRSAGGWEGIGIRNNMQVKMNIKMNQENLRLLEKALVEGIQQDEQDEVTLSLFVAFSQAIYEQAAPLIPSIKKFKEPDNLQLKEQVIFWQKNIDEFIPKEIRQADLLAKPLSRIANKTMNFPKLSDNYILQECVKHAARKLRKKDAHLILETNGFDLKLTKNEHWDQLFEDLRAS